MTSPLFPTSPDTWPPLPPGAAVHIVKLAPEGHETISYPGTVIDVDAPAPWLVLRATWVTRELDIDGLRFVTGDFLHEYFSPAHPFNVFSVFSPEGSLRGWYANVTYLSRLDPTTAPPTLYWHDLYLDLIALPDGAIIVRDEDELADSGLCTTDPALYTAIIRAHHDLLDLCRTKSFPFHER